MLSTKPYLVRAFFEWILDSEWTPFVVINTQIPGCNVPQEYIQNGEIIFNISPNAVRDLKLGNELIEFRATFSNVVRIVTAPIKAILAIYAEENGQGMFFDNEDEEGTSVSGWAEEGTSAPQQTDHTATKPTSHLRVVE